MKKNILRIGILMLLTIVFAIVMPKVIFAATIDSVDITVPEPVIGEKLVTDISKIQIKSDSYNDFKINRIDWYCDKSVDGETHLGNYEKITDIIFIISAIGLTLTINSIKKQNK